MKKHIHFVGIKGVGMAPLALIAKEAGFSVSGSDIADGFITDEILQKSGITPFVGFDASHVDGADLLITTGAHGGYENPEVQFAKSSNIPFLTQGEAVAYYMQGSLFDKKYTGISITGTHGKTTTSAMVAKVLSDGSLDPSWVIGTSHIPSLGFGGHYGKGNYFVAEADEYANEPQFDKTPKMLLQHPAIGVITNIEHDHPDIYPTMEDAEKAFTQFAKNIPHDGLLVICGDDPASKKLLASVSSPVATYGIGKDNAYVISSIVKSSDGIGWEVVHNGQSEYLTLPISGEHNCFNATAAYIVGQVCDIAFSKIQKSLHGFTGTKRRMEYIGQLPSGAFLYDDYAHHPTEIQKTLTAFKEKFPSKKIVCIFQPHTYSRTKLLFDQFVDSLSIANTVVLTDIYSSAREAFDSTVSSQMLADKLSLKTTAFSAPTLMDVVKYINSLMLGEDTILLTMGAGDVYTIANQLMK